jgi:1-acyl-sn-glycerol-3-phosphate acyltransferase
MTRDADPRSGRRIALIARLTAAGLLISAGALAVLPFAAITLCRARRWYAAWARVLALLALRICGIRLVVHRDAAWPAGQTVYVSNHPSTLDLFVLVALGMPNTRFFLSGYLQKYVPLRILARLMGTFFTVPQDRPAERVHIFQRADAELRRTGESVYLSPEGARVPGGRIGPFNKGSFHLATSLKVPIQPLYFFIPPEIDPGMGFEIRPGTVQVYVGRLIDTGKWRVEDVERNRDSVHELFVDWHRAIREAHRVPSTDSSLA